MHIATEYDTNIEIQIFSLAKWQNVSQKNVKNFFQSFDDFV